MPGDFKVVGFFRGCAKVFLSAESRRLTGSSIDYANAGCTQAGAAMKATVTSVKLATDISVKV